MFRKIARHRQPWHWKTASRSMRYLFANHRDAVAAVRQCLCRRGGDDALASLWDPIALLRNDSQSCKNCWWCGRQCFIMRWSGIASGCDRVVPTSRYVGICVATGASIGPGQIVKQIIFAMLSRCTDNHWCITSHEDLSRTSPVGVKGALVADPHSNDLRRVASPDCIDQKPV